MSNIGEIQLEQDLKTRTTVFQVFNSGDDISIPLIQRKCRVGYNSAYRVLRNLAEEGLARNCNNNGVFVFA